MKSKIAWVVTCMTLLAGTAMADLKTPSRSAIDPTTPPPLGPEVPLIIGTIVTLDERQVVLDTHDGNTVSFMVDSRTMMPTHIAPGQPMKVQFKVLESGAYMAQRFTPIYGEEGRELAARHGEIYSDRGRYAYGTYDSDRERYGDDRYRDDAYRDRDRDSDAYGGDVNRDDRYASDRSGTNGDHVEDGGELAQVTDDTDANRTGDDAWRNDDANRDDMNQLPQTASTGSWLAVLGVVSLAAAGGLSLTRRRRRV